MTTYVVSFTLPAAETNTGSQYPILVGDSTFLPDCTIFVKAGDTIRYTVTEPEGGNVIYQNTSNHDTDPDPDGFDEDTMNSQTKSSPGSWEYTVGTGNEDKFFTWFFYGSTPASNTANRKYSQRVQTVRVDGAPRMNFSTSAITVNQGGTINFSISGMGMYHQDNNAQLDSTANANKNKLYFAIFDQATGGSLINPTSYTGGGWDSSNNQLGRIYTSDQLTTLNIGSNMPTGTYYVYLTHFNSVGLGAGLANSGSSPAGNKFYGASNRLSSTALQFTVQAPASGPSAFDSGLGNDPSGPVNLNTQITSDAATISGISGGSGSLTVTASSSDSGGNPKVSVNNGTYATTGTVSNGDTVRLQFNAPSSAGTRTGSLTINGVVGSITVTSQDLSGGGGGSSGTSGTVNYGIEVLGPPDNNGNQDVIFGPNFRSSHHIASGSWSVNAGTSTGSGITPATSQTYTVEGMTSSNRDTVGVIILPDQSPFVGFVFNVNYLSGGFSITNNSLIALSGKYIALRY